MNSTIFKSFRNVLVSAFLVAGCGGAEPIPVDLATAAGPCDSGKEFVTDGMRMVMRDGQLTVEPVDDGQVKAAWAGYVPPKGGATTQAGCEGCH
jgi:hypothetical protein